MKKLQSYFDKNPEKLEISIYGLAVFITIILFSI